MLPIYILTSNSYIRCLRPFAFLFNRFWSSSQQVTIVGYEKVPFGLPDNFHFMSIGEQSNFTWSSGALRFLELIPENRFILFLEDYFLDAPVNVKAVEAAFAYHHKTVKIDLTNDRLKVPYHHFGDIAGYPMIRSDDEALFQTSLQCAIWDKHFMRRYLEPSETPWNFEKKGTQRVIIDRRSGRFNGMILGFYKPPVSYINGIGGEGSMPQTFALKRFPKWMLNELRSHHLLEE